MPTGIKIDSKTESRIIRRLYDPGNCLEIGEEFGYKDGRPVSRIMNEAIKDGRLPMKQLRLYGGIIQWQLDKIIDIIKRKQDKGQPINFTQIASQSKTGLKPRSVIYIYRNAEKQGLIKNNEIGEKEIDKIFRIFPTDIKKDFKKLKGKDKQLFTDFIRDCPKYFTNAENLSSRTNAKYIKREKMSKLIFRAGTTKIANEMAAEFVKNYHDHRFESNYTLGNFLYKWDGKRIVKGGKSVGYSSYYRINSRILYQSKKNGTTLINCFLSLLEKDLREKVEEITSDKKLLREAMQVFIDIYEEHKLFSRYTLPNFLLKWDVEKKEIRKKCKGNGFYNGVLNRIKINIESTNQTHYMPILLDMIGNPKDELRLQVEEIIYDKRLARDAATEFVSDYDKKSPDGEIYGLSSKFTLPNFLHCWDVELGCFNNSRNDGGYGDYFGFHARLRKTAGSFKQEVYIPVFLDMIDNPLKKKVEDIVTGERYRQDLKESNLEVAVRQYLEVA